MTHPLTPREKVAVFDPCPGCGADEPRNRCLGCSHDFAPHNRQAILDGSTVTALASGSGDHAELARLAEAIGPVEWHPGHLCRDDHPCDCAYVFDEGHAGAIATVHVSNGLPISEGGNDAPEPELAKLHQAFIAAANPATVLALLAENAALRDREKAAIKECSDWARQAGEATGKLEASEMAGVVEDWRDRATEAERKLAEAVGLLRKFRDAWRSGCGWLPSMNALDDEITAYLSKEAERV